MSSTVLRALPQADNEPDGTETNQLSSTGLTPLTELGSDLYKGAEGGLYPGGANGPPTEHLALGVARAGRVTPRDAAGNPHPDGKIGVLGVGLSNTRSDFAELSEMVGRSAEVHPAVVIANGAQRRKDAEMMANREAGYWETVDRKVALAGLTNDQVQVVWLKSALRDPEGEFPAAAHELHDHLTTTVKILAERFRNLQLVYVSSRTYAGYSEIALNPEPHAYESGFAVKWLVSSQILGTEGLECSIDGAMPWIGWGPYLWADGERARCDGLRWTREDMAGDGVHPSAEGRRKVGQLLMEFFTSSPTASGWFNDNRAPVVHHLVPRFGFGVHTERAAA